MTRRTAAVLRVAHLQESAARGAIGRAIAARADADLAHEQSLADLASTELVTGSAGAVVVAHDARARRAETATTAARRVADAQQEVSGALSRWQAMRQRRHLVAELDARQRSLDALEQMRKEQRLIDDLNSSQAARRGAAS